MLSPGGPEARTTSIPISAKERSAGNAGGSVSEISAQRQLNFGQQPVARGTLRSPHRLGELAGFAAARINIEPSAAKSNVSHLVR